MIDANDSLLTFAFGLLTASPIAYFLARSKFSSQLARTEDARSNEIRELRVTFDERLKREQSEAQAQLEKARSDGRDALQAALDRLSGESRRNLDATIERYELKLQQQSEALDRLRSEHRRDMEDTVTRHEEKLKEQTESELSVTIHPFVNTQSKGTLFTKETEVEIGYKYQLFVRGLPCFEPHSVVIETSVEKEVDARRLEMFKDKALELAEALANLKSGGLAGKVITIAKTAVKVLK